MNDVEGMSNPAETPQNDSEQRPSSDPPVSPTVLVVDDERNIRRTLDLVLRGEGYDVVEAETGEEALELLAHGQKPVDLVIVDLMLPGIGGLEVLARIRHDESTRALPVVVISGHATVHDAVKAIKLGAGDFFEKPVTRERVLVSVKNALRSSELARKVQHLESELLARYEMIGRSTAMQKLYKEIDRVAPTKTGVLIMGESGTGKELVSRAIHRLSPRLTGPFVKVNCAAIPNELFESELFGHERGSFTGAVSRKRGYFEQAHGGTLFLDEIGDMAPSAQAKVLRTLQSGEVCRVGSEHPMHVDVRVLAASNKDLEKEVAAGRFREDLYFRLAVFPLRVPALRERMDDMRPLADAFMGAFCKENGLKLKRIDATVYAALEKRSFPGNVRELKNVIERAAILSADVVTVADLPEDPHASPFDDDSNDAAPSSRETVRTPSIPPPPSLAEIPRSDGGRRFTLREFRDAAERRYIIEVLQSLDWNISRAAIVLGVERTNLHKKIRAYDIRRS